MTPSPLLSPEDFDILRLGLGIILALLILAAGLILSRDMRRIAREQAELKAELELLSSSYLASQALEGKPLAPIEWPPFDNGIRFDSLAYLDQLDHVEAEKKGDVEA